MGWTSSLGANGTGSLSLLHCDGCSKYEHIHHIT